MPDILQTLIPIIVFGMLLIAGILFVIALWYFRRGRRDKYWRQRRDASLHGWQLFLISVTMAFLSSAICLFSGFANTILEPAPVATEVSVAASMTPSTTPIYITATPEESPSITPGEAVEQTAAETDTPPTATSLATTDSPASPSAIGTLAPTLTISPAASPVQIETLPSSVTPLPEANVQIVAVDSDITADFQPAGSALPLPAGINRIYFWAEYTALTDGIAWQRLLLYEGQLMQGGAYLWSGGDTGSEVFFFGNSAGFPAGEYEIRLLLAGELKASQELMLE
jgi:hypothetical protein